MTNILVILNAGSRHNTHTNILDSRPFLDETLLQIFVKTFSSFVSKIIVVGERPSSVPVGIEIDFVSLEGTEPSDGGSAQSLSHYLHLSELNDEDFIFACYADLLFFPSLISDMDKNRINVVTDSTCPSKNIRSDFERVVYTSGEADEFVGFIGGKLKGLKTLFPPHCYGSLSDAIPKQLLSKQQFNQGINCIEAKGLWLHLENYERLPSFFFGSKGEVIQQLELSKEFSIPLSRVISYEDLQSNDKLRDIVDFFRTNEILTLIVRSSTQNEDQLDSSNAGRYLSVPNIEVRIDALKEAALAVFGSYDLLAPNSIVLVQHQISEYSQIGVLTTRCVGSLRPYFVIEVSNDKSISAITAGEEVTRRTLFIRRDSESREIESNFGSTVSELIKQSVLLEKKFNYPSLDIEFLINLQNEILILQVRPLVSDYLTFRKLDSQLHLETEFPCLDSINESDYKKTASGKWFLSDMADWNPAEIIGIYPNPLAISLYKVLVTDEVWAIQRAEAGYTNMINTPLMHVINGKPYIDVVASLRSLIPVRYDRDATERIIENSIEELSEHQELHDRIEFGFFPTCISFNLRQFFPSLASSLSLCELDSLNLELRAITLGLIERTSVLMKSSKESTAFDSPKADLLGSLALIKPMVLRFAHLARAGFVSRSVLDEFVEMGHLEFDRSRAFIEGLDNVTSQLLSDGWKVKIGKMKKDFFFKKYGHLRPSTYDINSISYAEENFVKLQDLIDTAQEPIESKFEWTKKEKRSVEMALRKIKMPIEAETLLSFLRNSIIGREQAKLEFSKPLSILLSKLKSSKEFGDLNIGNFTVHELSTFLQGKISVDSISRLDVERSQRMQLNSILVMPETITQDTSLKLFEVPNKRGNFPNRITSRGRCFLMTTEKSILPSSLDGKIVCIRSADPGYDFLFSYRIAGLITAFGGPNSHMAIRCAELGIAAAIGIGNTKFSKLTNDEYLEIDGENQIVSRLSGEQL
jgi:hypothetical protein